MRSFRYDPVADTIQTVGIDAWTESVANTLPGGFTVFQNKLYILGGFTVNVAMTNRIFEFNPDNSAGTQWVQKTAVLPVALGYVPTTAIGSLIFTGGDFAGRQYPSDNHFEWEHRANLSRTVQRGHYFNQFNNSRRGWVGRHYGGAKWLQCDCRQCL